MDAILEKDVELVIHSGDVFDSVRPATHVIIGFLKQTFRITREGIPYLVAAGNHETPRLRTTTAALEYANLVNAYSAHGFDLDYWSENIDGLEIGVTLVPHGAISGAGAVTPERGADINVMVTHGMVPGLEAKSHEMGEAEPALRDAGGRLRLHRPRPLPRLSRAPAECVLRRRYRAVRVRGGGLEAGVRRRGDRGR